MNLCITCTKQGGAKQKLMPIIEEQDAAFLERPFRAQETNAPHGCGLERHFSSLWGGSSCTRRTFCGSGVARAAPVGHSAVPGQTRAAPIEHSAAPGQTRSALFEYSAAPGRARAAISSYLRLRGGLEQPFRAICGSGPGSSGHMQQIAALSGKAGHEAQAHLEPQRRSKLYE